MARFLFVLWLDGGNINPFARLGDELVALGHEVAVLGPEQLRGVFEPAGVEFRPSATWMPGPAEVLAATEAAGPDVLVVDHMATEALGAAEASGLPTAVLVHTLLEANRVGDDIAPMWMTGPASTANDSRAALGLPSVESHSDLLAFADTLLVAAPSILEPHESSDPRVVHTGPLYRPPRDGIGTVDLPDGTAPLIVGCAGTAGTDPEREPLLLERMMAAIAATGRRGLVTVPPYIDLDALPRHAGIVTTRYAPHPVVLPPAAAFLTHAGLGSVCASLVAATPMVCLPLGREQPVNAAAVERIGAGVQRPVDSDTSEIAAAIDEVIGTEMPRVDVEVTTAVREVERLSRSNS